MLARLFLLFILIPIVEIALLVWIAYRTSFWAVLALRRRHGPVGGMARPPARVSNLAANLRGHGSRPCAGRVAARRATSVRGGRAIGGARANYRRGRDLAPVSSHPEGSERAHRPPAASPVLGRNGARFRARRDHRRESDRGPRQSPAGLINRSTRHRVIRQALARTRAAVRYEASFAGQPRSEVV